MDRSGTPSADSLTRGGGMIPGQDGAPAFTVRTARPMPVPVLVAVPHAGRAYPSAILQRLRHGAKVG
ncbi:MAG: hypothetical protein WBA68_00160, partial [Alteraurantiacibacter sp.]